jgi:hypothetical protein
MTTQQKAAYLVVKYMSKVVSQRVAIECALVAVDEIIPIVNSYENALPASQQSNYLEYWQEVKQEIEKL